MRHSFYHNVRNERQYRAATGLSPQDFERLYAVFAPLYTPKEPNATPDLNPVVLTDKREALFFILHYYKAYPTLQNMGAYFGFSDAAAHAALARLKPCLKTALEQLVVMKPRLFATENAFVEAFAGLEDVVLDVTEIPIERPQNDDLQKERYSGKKNSTR